MQNTNCYITVINIIKLANKTITKVVEDARYCIEEGDTTTLDSCLEDLKEILRLHNALDDYIATANAEQLEKQFKQNNYYLGTFDNTKLLAYLKQFK